MHQQGIAKYDGKYQATAKKTDSGSEKKAVLMDAAFSVIGNSTTCVYKVSHKWHGSRTSHLVFVVEESAGSTW